MNMLKTTKKYKSFQEFWPFYLSEHSVPLNRKLHFVGTLLVLIFFVIAMYSGRWILLIALPVLGYGFAWVGHFIIEKNRPATFIYPFWSLLGDFKMFFMTLFGQIDLELQKHVNKQ